jgi:predicted ester cyclase
LSLEKNKTIIHRVFEAINSRSLALLDDLIAPTYIDHTLKRRGIEDLKQFLTYLFKTFPDWHEVTEDIIAEGNKVWIRVKYSATHTGEYRGSLPLIPERDYILQPTGKKFTFTGIHIYHIANSKVTERESVYDLLDFFKKLGVIEYT